MTVRLQRSGPDSRRSLGEGRSLAEGETSAPQAERRARRTRRSVWAYVGLASIACALVAASVIAAPGRPGLFGAVLALLMLAVAVIDAEAFIIPDGLNAAALLLGAAAALAEPESADVLMAAARGAVLAISFLGLRALYRWLRGRQGIGLGDVKLAAVAGVWIDWPLMPMVVEFAALAALAAYGLGRFINRRPASASARLPFGLFFAPAIWLGWLVQTNFWPAV